VIEPIKEIPFSILHYSLFFFTSFFFFTKKLVMSDTTNTPLLTRRRLDSQEEDEEELDDQLLQQTDYGSAVYHYPPYLQPGHFTSLEKLFFFTSSILLIVLFVFVGLYARSSQKEDDPVIIPMPKHPNQNHTKKAVRGTMYILKGGINLTRLYRSI
jgi:hypothetical protein